jgi:hypothetical protein
VVLPEQSERHRAGAIEMGQAGGRRVSRPVGANKRRCAGYDGVKKKMSSDGHEESELASSTVEAGEPDRWDPGEGRRQWSERISGGEDVRDIEPGK